MRMERLVGKEKVVTAETVNATATVTSSTLRLSYGESFSFILTLSGASPSVNLYYDIIDSDENSSAAVDTGADSDKAWVSPTANGLLVSAATATCADGFSPAVSKWVRFRIVGTASNGAATVASLVIMYQ